MAARGTKIADGSGNGLKLTRVLGAPIKYRKIRERLKMGIPELMK